MHWLCASCCWPKRHLKCVHNLFFKTFTYPHKDFFMNRTTKTSVQNFAGFVATTLCFQLKLLILEWQWKKFWSNCFWQGCSKFVNTRMNSEPDIPEIQLVVLRPDVFLAIFCIVEMCVQILILTFGLKIEMSMGIPFYAQENVCCHCWRLFACWQHLWSLDEEWCPHVQKCCLRHVHFSFEVAICDTMHDVNFHIAECFFCRISNKCSSFSKLQNCCDMKFDIQVVWLFFHFFELNCR